MTLLLVFDIMLVIAILALFLAGRKLIAAHRQEVAAKDELIAAQVARIDILGKLACCGCGHALDRHDDPDSADGYGCRDCNCQAVHNLVDVIERPRRV